MLGQKGDLVNTHLLYGFYSVKKKSTFNVTNDYLSRFIGGSDVDGVKLERQQEMFDLQKNSSCNCIRQR